MTRYSRIAVPAGRRRFTWALLASLLLMVGASAALPVHRVRAAGAQPLPSDRLHFGVANGPADLSWMTGSGVPWRYRYQYLAGGVNVAGNNWAVDWAPNGQFALDYMNASAASGYIPVFTYYELLQSSPSTGSSEPARDYSNLNNPSTMKAYYDNFAILMQRAGQFGKQVVVHVEPDLWGYLQSQYADVNTGGSHGAAAIAASVQSSGSTEVTGLPNTAVGFAEAFLKIRDRYAPNALLGIHASGFAGGDSIDSLKDTTYDFNADADRLAAFINSLGVAPNGVTSTWDLVFHDIDDHDAAWFEQNNPSSITNRYSPWHDPNNQVAPTFTQIINWNAELHARTGKPLVEWQIPVGNQYFLTMNNTCGHYQDNVAPYIIAHAQEWYAAGVVAALIGAGNPCTTSYLDALTPPDGITNNNDKPTTDTLGGCNACNTHLSQYADDDGGYIRLKVGEYYAGPSPTPSPTPSPAPTPSASPPAGSTSGHFRPVTPFRLCDTRAMSPDTPQNQCSATALGPDASISIQVTGVPGSGVPTGATAAVLNVTAINPTDAGYVSVFPSGSSRPLASNLNFVAGQTVPNLVQVPLGTDGKVLAYNHSGTTDLVVDVAGYFTLGPAGDGLYNPLTPARICDTRTTSAESPQNQCSGISLSAGETRIVKVAGLGGVSPDAAAAVVLNVTVTDPSAGGFLTVYPSPHGNVNYQRPLASNLNFVAGQTVANRVTVPIASDGSIAVYNLAGSADMVIDVSGWYTNAFNSSAPGFRFFPATPARACDTRPVSTASPQNQCSGQPVLQGQSLSVQALGGGVPSGAAAAVINVTVTNADASGYLTVYPSTDFRPLASDLNRLAGQTVPNLVIAKIGSDGRIDVFNNAGVVDVVLDISGWYA